MEVRLKIFYYICMTAQRSLMYSNLYLLSFFKLHNILILRNSIIIKIYEMCIIFLHCDLLRGNNGIDIVR